MCGINGVFHYAGGVADRRLLERQSLAQRTAGPTTMACGTRRRGLAHAPARDRRPLAGRPPADAERGRVRCGWSTTASSTTGPRSARGSLARGHRFRGHSDTEALLHLYEEQGLDCSTICAGCSPSGSSTGPGARCCWGATASARSRSTGTTTARRIVFASELKALMLDPAVPREVDHEAIAYYLTFQYVPGPRTIWRGVHKLRPGTSSSSTNAAAREASTGRCRSGPTLRSPRWTPSRRCASCSPRRCSSGSSPTYRSARSSPAASTRARWWRS